ncbi:MAG: hypothetical protein P1U72_13440, partial [Paracoccaceae bacterium]|nr:hypothetical protein [Paracoccaceae bacterium]
KILQDAVIDSARRRGLDPAQILATVGVTVPSEPLAETGADTPATTSPKDSGRAEEAIPEKPASAPSEEPQGAAEVEEPPVGGGADPSAPASPAAAEEAPEQPEAAPKRKRAKSASRTGSETVEQDEDPKPGRTGTV